MTTLQPSLHSHSSGHSVGSRTSNTSKLSDELLTQKSKAMAAQVRLKFIEEEQRLRKTQYETELKVKKEQRLKLYKL